MQDGGDLLTGIVETDEIYLTPTKAERTPRANGITPALEMI
ncbi:MAG TPA: hypothetical protein VKQ28_10410 [Candidatus Acidoferrum sp.]|nr:hypothetical protein [Candidatus Acidoferrum sp.]